MKEPYGTLGQYENASIIKDKIYETKIRIKNKMDRVMRGFKGTGISYESPAERIKNIVESWDYEDDLASAGLVQQIGTIMNKAMNVVDMNEEQLNKIEENEFKRVLAERVLKLRTRQEMAILIKEEEKAYKEKVGLWGKLTGKQKEKIEKISELEKKRGRLSIFWEKLKNSGLSHEEIYSVHEILAEISMAKSIGVSAEEKDGLTRMEKVISGIFKVNEQKVTAIVDEKSRSMSSEYRSDIFIENHESKISRQPTFQYIINDEVEFLQDPSKISDQQIEYGVRLNIERILGDVSNAMYRVRAMDFKERKKEIEREMEGEIERDTDEWRR